MNVTYVFTFMKMYINLDTAVWTIFDLKVEPL